MLGDKGCNELLLAGKDPKKIPKNDEQRGRLWMKVLLLRVLLHGMAYRSLLVWAINRQMACVNQ